MQMPALALAAVPGRRKTTVELAVDIEKRGFQGVYCASFGDGLGLCLSLAHATKTIRFGTSIAQIYVRHPFEMAQTAAYIHEMSDGRFVLGLGVSHGPNNQRLGVATGKPLSDMRNYIEQIRAAGKQVGELPPIVPATLRKKMVDLAVEVGDGAVWANASRSHMADSLANVPKERIASGFFIGDMIPTCFDDDRDAAANVMKRTLTGYVTLPNYRNYWKEAGYVEEMEAIEKAIAEKRQADVPKYLSDKWLADCTLFGPAARVRDELDKWYAAGIKTPILVPSSAAGNQMKAIEEMFATFTG